MVWNAFPATFNRALPPPPSAAGTLTGYIVCERDAKGLSVTEVTAAAPIAAGARATAEPGCPKKRHVVSGGFVISPLPAGIGSQVPIVSVDEHLPVGNRAWHVGLHPWVFSNLPPGESLLATAYCKKGAAPRKK